MSATGTRPKLTRRLIIAARLRAEHPRASHTQLGRLCGISRTGYTVRLLRYLKAVGQHQPRRHRFRFKVIRAGQQGWNRDR